MNNLFFFYQNPKNKGNQKVWRNWSAPQLFFIAYASVWPACGIQRLGIPALLKRTQLLSQAITKSISHKKKKKKLKMI